MPAHRGRVHQVAFWVFLALGIVLVVLAPTGGARVAAAVYTAGLSGLFGTSALYHRGDWEGDRLVFMKRLDHSMIFVKIAATYTPFCALAIAGVAGWATLTAVWLGAGVGFVLGLAGIAERRFIGMALYMTLGWAAVLSLPALVDALGVGWVVLIALGGVAYTLGATTLARRWPDPVPTHFGYHEVFHTMTVVGAVCIGIPIWNVVLNAG